MTNFMIQFSHWWLLLLIIPAVALTLIPYFRLSKKYRKTRNRITSMTLHIIIMILTISILAGTVITYSVPNTENEIILLVDVSDSSKQLQEKKNNLVNEIINYGSYGGYRFGIVLFGFDQVNAVPLTYDVNTLYDKYLDALEGDMPDTSATNICDALRYTRTLFTNPKTAKIVLISDGKETDEDATTVIRSILLQGIKVDTAFVSESFNGSDVQITNVELPDYNILVGQEINIYVNISSTISGNAYITLYDKNRFSPSANRVDVPVTAGTQTVTLKHTFTELGFHDLSIEMTINDDFEQNNVYNTYVNLSVFNKVLIMESAVSESDELVKLLTDEDFLVDTYGMSEVFDVSVVNLRDENATIPSTINELREYDLIILNNISNADLGTAKNIGSELVNNTNPALPEKLDALLYEYVNVHGGGVFTTGGNVDINGQQKLNAYNRADMVGSIYQSFLPVQIVTYTPPLGVVVVIDRSASMGAVDHQGQSHLYHATRGARAILGSMADRDYFGIVTLDTTNAQPLNLTPVTETAYIEERIDYVYNMGARGGTFISGAIESAGSMLIANDKVDKRHMILITDADEIENQRTQYETSIRNFYEQHGITFSAVVVDAMPDGNTINTPLDSDSLNPPTTSYQRMLRAAIIGHGRIYASTDSAELVDLMRNDLRVPDIQEMNYETFNPKIREKTSPVMANVKYKDSTSEYIDVTLDGFYGVKKRTDVNPIVLGEFDVPIYAQWRFGAGMVGSFMSDLNGTWSDDFMNGDSDSGRMFIVNVINNLMPLSDIRPSELTVKHKEDNYLNELTIYATLEEGQYISGQIEDLSDEDVAFDPIVSFNEVTDLTEDRPYYVTTPLSKSNNYSRVNFVVKKSAIYEITLTIMSSLDEPIKTFTLHKVFSYSKEYDMYAEVTEAEFQMKMVEFADMGGGVMIEDFEDPIEVFDGFEPYVQREYDPRYLFAILATILFLMDIAVRKFKFKWPHEIYRDYKLKKAN